MIVMKEVEVLGVKAQILDAGCSQYRQTYVIPTTQRGSMTVLNLNGFQNSDIDINGSIVKSLLDDGLLKHVASGYEIVFKWHN